MRWGRRRGLGHRRTVLDDEAALEVLLSVKAWLGGVPDVEWQIGRVGSGWVGGPTQVRGNMGVAISADGKVATFPPSMVRRADAVELLQEVSSDVVRTWADVVAGRGGISAEQAQALVNDCAAQGSVEDWTVEVAPGGYLVRSVSRLYAVSGDGKVRVLSPNEDPARALRSLALPDVISIAQRVASRDGGLTRWE